MQPSRPAGAGGRRPTGATLQRFPSLHRSSFLVELQDQLLSQLASEQERENQREVASIHAILRKPPESRDSQDIDVLYEWVLKNGSTNKIFQGAQEIICKTICREMTLLELPPKGVVCYQGDFGDTFYIIISGSVSLFIDPKAKLRAIQEEMTGTPERSDRYFRGLQQQASGEAVVENEDTGKHHTKHFGSFIKQISAGGTFGELAVLDPTARRSCTVVCDVNTSFICLKRGAYQRLIRITNSTQLDFTPAEFLETLFFFEAWPHGELTRLSNRLRHLSFPAETFLTRVGSEANVVYFIYSGIVQETRPILQYLNNNGTVSKCTSASDGKNSRKQSDSSDSRAKGKNAVRKVALELNLYQDHDICGEYPIFFEKPLCNTDLLAITDVKTLIMDRETWKELFFMHGLDHILESYNKFLKLAQARENWRKIRMKLALANPGITLTITTKEMMLDGKCMCGWCGSIEHITGDLTCPSLIACKKKEADREKRPRPKRPKKMFEMGLRALAVKNTVNFVNSLVESVGGVATEPTTSMSGNQGDSGDKQFGSATIFGSTTASPRAASRRVTLKLVAQHIVAENNGNDNSSRRADDPSTPRTTRSNQVAEEFPPSTHEHDGSPRKAAIADIPALCKASEQLYAIHQQSLARGENGLPPDVKVEEIRKGAFTECLEAQYKQAMLKKVKRVSNMKEYYGARTSVLDTVAQDPALPLEQRCQQQPRKPKIPKPNRRLCSKNKQPRPDRFNRKINRMLKKLRVNDHPLPVVEESLRDL